MIGHSAVRYCARGPLALERLHAPAGLEALTSPEARLTYRLPEPDVHGRQELRLTPLELLERLARLVPPPRIHRHRDHGVLAPNARLRSTVVTIGRPVPDEIPVDAERPPSPDHPSHPVTPPDPSDKPGPTGTTPRSRSSRMLWAQLVARIYEVLPLLCPACSGEMRIISFITFPATVQGILLHLDLPHRPPRVSPARGPPQAVINRPSRHPSGPDSHRDLPASCFGCSPAPPGSRTPPPSPTLRQLARPDAPHYLASALGRVFESLSMGQAVKTHLRYTPSDLVLTASVRFLRRPGRSLAE